MYEDFQIRDPFTGETHRCQYQSLIVGIATRHSDTVDIKFLVDDHAVWLGLPHPVWPEFRRRTGQALSDRMAVDLAGLYLKHAIENGLGAECNHWNDISVEDLLRLTEELGWLSDAPPAAKRGRGRTLDL